MDDPVDEPSAGQPADAGRRPDRRSRWQRVYDALFRVFGPAQVSEAESEQTAVTEQQRISAQATEQWAKETRDGRTYLVKRPPQD